MKKIILGSALIVSSVLGFSQPNSIDTDPSIPVWGYGTKALGDSCGTYFNNYIGLTKTTGVLQEYMRTGDAMNSSYYNGRAQRFSVSQPVEVSGVEFFAYETSPLDSVMVITSLHSYNALNDSLGPELTRDTVYVKHTSFTFILPNISVKSYFDAPIVMTDDYVIAMHTTLDEELIIITNDYSANDGNGEGNSHAMYMNPAFPSFTGWYSNSTDFSFDYDYLMNPLVKFDLFEPFVISNDTICPGAINAGCVAYTQTGNFTNSQYNSQYASPTSHIRWLWGDGFQNVDLLNACHTYTNAGTYNISLRDTFFRHDFASPYCVVDVSQPIVALGEPTPDFSFIQDGLTADFTNESTNSDSVWWNFGDASTGTDLEDPSHTYTTVGSFQVWLYAYNECHVDSIMQVVSTDDVSISDNELRFEIYPNPANEFVKITVNQNNVYVEILNILGEVVTQKNLNQQQNYIDVSALSSGTYFVRLTSEDGEIITRKIVVKH